MSYVYQQTEIYRIYGPILYDLLGHYESIYNLNPNQIIKYDNLNEGNEIIPISGSVMLPKYIMYLSQLPIVQRLKNIKQLSHTYQLFPGAAHSRYEHSLGVMNRCSTLCEKIESLLSEKCSEENEISLNNDDKVLLDIASFLHDIGHPAWGHALDSITGYVIELLSKMEVFLFSPRKLDTTVTIYLLTHNNQLEKALNIIGSNEIVQNNIKSNLNKIVSQIIIEEEPLMYPELEEIYKLKKIHLLTTILGNYFGRPGINADRLDWLARDVYHANIISTLEPEDEKRYRNYIDKNIKNDFEINVNDCEYLFISEDSFLKEMNKLRELIYVKIYEGLEKAFIDALFTRLVYSSIYIIHNTGGKIASLFVVTRAIMGYLLMSDDLLQTYTINILNTGKRYVNYLGQLTPSINYISKSKDLIELLKYENYIMHTIKNSELVSTHSNRYEIDFIYEKLNAIEKHIIIMTAISFEKFLNITLDSLKEKINLKDEEIKLLALIYQDLITAPRINSVVSFKIPTLETRTQENFYEGDIYLLINYYLFRRLDDNFREIHSVSEFLKLLKTKYENQPFFFVITDPLKQEKTVELFDKICDNIIDILRNIFATLI
ncbi:MAG: HD domain-containing protein, partial [Candidatus Helarchaeota archaeon]|nr:HD domain-containing protein [Candidatus Helarchaeota archaeon]